MMEKYELGGAQRRQHECSLFRRVCTVSSIWMCINWPNSQHFCTAFFLIWRPRVVLPTKHLLHTACEAHGNVPCESCAKSVKVVMHVYAQSIFAILRFSSCYVYLSPRKKKTLGMDCIFFGKPSYSFFVYIVIFILCSYSHSGGRLHRLAGCAADIFIVLLNFGILTVAERFVSKCRTLVLILRAAFLVLLIQPRSRK